MAKVAALDWNRDAGVTAIADKYNHVKPGFEISDARRINSRRSRFDDAVAAAVEAGDISVNAALATLEPAKPTKSQARVDAGRHQAGPTGPLHPSPDGDRRCVASQEGAPEYLEPRRRYTHAYRQADADAAGRCRGVRAGARA